MDSLAVDSLHQTESIPTFFNNPILIFLFLGFLLTTIVLYVRYANSSGKKLLEELKNRIITIRSIGTAASKEIEQRENQLTVAFKDLTAQQFFEAWEQLTISELSCKGIGQDTLDRISAYGITRIVQIGNNVGGISGIGPKRQMLIAQRLDFLRRRVNDGVTGEPKQGLPTTADERCARTALNVLLADSTWTSRGEIVSSEGCKLLETLLSLRNSFGFWIWLKLDREEFLNRVKALVIDFEHKGLYELEARVNSISQEISSRLCSEYKAPTLKMFEERTADIFDLLILRFKRKKLHGGLAETIARKIEAIPFYPQLKGINLRPYQIFGGKFIISQKRVLLGDEMGLGKTLQAIATATYLKSKGKQLRCIVVVPASLMENWFREITRFTDLNCVLAHGGSVYRAVIDFLAQGEIMVVSYETLRRSVLPQLPASLKLDLIVADEAHYIKNPNTQRTIAVTGLIQRSDFALLMTGTPIENRVEEMVNLIRFLQPEIAATVQFGGEEIESQFTPSEFTEKISPVYLRRKQSDVLRELPEKIECMEWVQLHEADLEAYRAAVFKRSYPDMRRTVTLGNGNFVSAKLERLRELLDEYESMGRKVIIFSFFLDVLDSLKISLQTPFVLSGQVPVASRQRILDDFTNMPGHSILLAQVMSVGVGLNIQAASVVIFMEPQYKPSTEWQAIARAHRMGQKTVVMVHRLMAKDTVDERILELLSQKIQRVESFSDESRLKAVSMEATKTESEEGFASQVVEREISRLKSLQKEG